ncbi:hypothetical protein [Pedobacter sp. Leaf132]|uniref:hypothetical protein n=1 Tax=Pedobacter sp. Leaf132 TaxID=2876557 RepID=UPI001E64E61D|nr:hypothetical protein [Pedobacter sp. Leaf132]
MILKKTVTMAPVLLALTAGVYNFQSTNMLFNEANLPIGSHAIEQSGSISKIFGDYFQLDEKYLESRIKFLTSKWLKQTIILSDVHAIIANENFQQILSLGELAIPSILNELRIKPSILVWAMNLITGKKISATNLTIDEACKAWVKWGIANQKIHQ